MTRFSTAIKINAPKEKVWEVLADLGSIYKWNPGVSHSYGTSPETGGEGAMRHCDLQNAKGGSMGYLKERAFDWRESEGFTIDVYESNLPLKRNHVRFDLESNGDGTVVTITPDYGAQVWPAGRNCRPANRPPPSQAWHGRYGCGPEISHGDGRSCREQRARNLSTLLMNRTAGPSVSVDSSLETSGVQLTQFQTSGWHLEG